LGAESAAGIRPKMWREVKRWNLATKHRVYPDNPESIAATFTSIWGITAHGVNKNFKR
jgi:hypothetical protein